MRINGVFRIAAAMAIVLTPSWAQEPVPDMDAAFSTLANYDEGGDTTELDLINDRISAALNTYTLKRDLEGRLLDILQLPELSEAARDFAMKQLYRVATERSVEVLTPLLYLESTGEMARVALERVRANTATDALVEAMRKTKGQMRAGIIYSLGERKDPRAAQAITKFSGRGESDVIHAAIWALGEIGGPVAVKDLTWCRTNTIAEHRDFATRALFRVAERYLEEGDIRGALGVYDRLFVKPEPIEIRQRALRGILRAEGEAAIGTVLEVLKTEGPALQETAFRAVHELPGKAVTLRCAEALPEFSADNQILMLHALAGRGDPAALSAIHGMLRSSNAGVRAAAIDAMGVLGDGNSVAALLAHMLRARPDEVERIRASLIAMQGPGVDDELIEEVLGPNRRIKSEIIRVLVARETATAANALIWVAMREVPALQAQALEGLGKIASAEAIPLLIDFMVNAENAEVRQLAREATLSTLQRAGQSEGGTEALTNALLRKDVPMDVKLDLLELVRASGDDAAIPALENLVKRDKGELGRASLDALCAWPSAAPLDAMTNLSKTMRRASNRGTWVSGYLRLLGLADSDTPRLKEHFGALANAVATREEKETLLELLRDWGAVEGAAIAGKFVGDAEVGGLASEVVMELAE